MSDLKKLAYRPSDLDETPSVDAFLERLGAGVFQRDSIRSVLGRNNNWIGETTKSRTVFVKQLHDGDREARLARTARAATAAAENAVIRMPRLLGTDEQAALVALEYLPNARTGSELAAEDGFTLDHCRDAGRQLANFHMLPDEGFDHTEHPLPPLGALDGLSMPYYVQASSAELHMWRLLQNDTALVEALTRLRDEDRANTDLRTPIHGDLRLDQFLDSDGLLYLSDFEEARIGDPARDIGAFAGEWLFLAASTLPTALAASLLVGQIATHTQIVATGVGEIEARSPKVAAFFESYLENRPAARADGTLAARATAYAGWHMLDRMLAGAAKSSRLSAVSKAAAGIGRTLLLSPAEFAGTLGLTSCPTTNGMDA
ncbi:class V lanthionine synthetase subunit LxmK [Actinomycetes bacterium M1A6_2h]